jgi:CRP-like cAMP-binding protein
MTTSRYDQDKLKASVQTLQFSRKQTLYHTGDPAQSVFRVCDGLVRLIRMTPEGKIMTVRHVMPGDFFGEEAFVGGKREEVAEVLIRTQIEAIDPQFINFGDLLTITHSLSKQIQHIMDYQYHLQTGDLYQRVSRYLMKLSETPLCTFDEENCPVVSATHELIAEGTASARESVSKIINELRVDGLIESGYRSVVLLNVPYLRSISSGFGLFGNYHNSRE